MKHPHTIDDERAALISQRIGETFDFVRDVIEDPAILEEIPDGSEIDIRHVMIDSHVYHIVAFRSESDSERWIARTTGRSIVDDSSDRRLSMLIRLESDISAKAAMDSVESALQAAAVSNQIAHQIA
jgi:hypothetical protein